MSDVKLSNEINFPEKLE